MNASASAFARGHSGVILMGLKPQSEANEAKRPELNGAPLSDLSEGSKKSTETLCHGPAGMSNGMSG